MQGVSRGALKTARETLHRVLDSGVDWGRLSADLFGVVDVLDGHAALRRALGDPSRETEAKQDLVARLFGGKIDDGSLEVLKEASGSRWSTERDFSDAVEELAVETQFAMADAAARADDVEEQLFRFERTVAGHGDLRDRLDDRRSEAGDKATLVRRLVDGKVHPEAEALLVRAASAPRGRRFAKTIEEYLAVGERLRDQFSALVTVAGPLSQEQQERLARALERIYERRVLLQIVVDESVLGGIRVQVGDEVVDGTVLRRLEGARRAMGS